MMSGEQAEAIRRHPTGHFETHWVTLRECGNGSWEVTSDGMIPVGVATGSEILARINELTEAGWQMVGFQDGCYSSTGHGGMDLFFRRKMAE